MVSLFKIEPKRSEINASRLQLVFYLFAFIIICQLVRLQIIEHKKFEEKARQMRQPLRAFSFRGEIVDRNGIRLAGDNTTYDVYAHPKYYDKKTTLVQMASVLSPYLKKPSDVLLEKLEKLDAPTVTLAKGIDRDSAIKIKKLEVKGLDLVRTTKRVYPQGNLASHILGYVNLDANIYAGVESTGAKKLEAFPKIKPIEYDGRGDIIYDFNTDPTYAAFPLIGKRVMLTIDTAIQHVAETELSKMMQKTKADRGTVIVLNPKNGEVLGFAVLPDYNPNEYKKAKLSVTKNWVLSDVYPPGSTFKIMTVASALQTGSITENEQIVDTGKVKIAGWDIENYDYRSHGAPGTIGLKYLFTHSSNIGSLKVALKTPPYEHYKMLRLFGIGSKTGIDLPGESAGIIPPPETWDKVRHATIGFGYSIASTPIQMASAVASLANNGVWVTPHVIKYNKDESIKKIKTRRVLSPEITNTMTKILAASIQASDATAGKIPNYLVAGKTGTSRKPNPNGPGYLPGQVFTSFAGYFPAKDPQVLIMVVIDNPKGVEMWGSTVAGPVFNAIATEVARILNIPPDAPGLNVKKKENA